MGYFAKRGDMKRIKRLLDQGCDKWYPGTVWWKEKTKHYIRVYPYSTNHGFNYRKYLQKMSNRRIRRKGDETFNRGKHKRVVDIWWELT